MSLLAAPPPSTVSVLTGWGTVLNGAVGVFLLLIWWVTYHRVTAPHRYVELGLKAVLVSSTIIIASTFTRIFQWTIAFNSTTGNWIKNQNSSWPSNCGVLTFLEAFFVLMAVFEILHLVSPKRFKGARGGGGGDRIGAKGFNKAVDHHERFGWFVLGPLAVTLPGAVGILVTGSLSDVALHVGQPVANWCGLG